MKKLTPDDPETRSADLVGENVERLREIFPEAFTEGRVDFDVLKQLLGGAIEKRDEKYGLNWHGKRRARQLALTPSTGTLRPCPEESVDWDTTKNLVIEGDNLEALKLLQKSYAGKVKLIYIDPPYNTGKDFVYNDHFQDNIQNYLQVTGQVAGADGRLSSNTEASGRFHTDWLNMFYPRLQLARQLLRDDGVLIISIDEREYSHLRTICMEVFGEENQIGTVIWKNATDNNPTQIATEHEYLLFVGRSKAALAAEWKSTASDLKDALLDIGIELASKHKGSALQTAYKEWFREHKSELGPLDRYKYIDEGGVYTGSQSVHNPGREGYRYDIPHPVTGEPCKQPLMGYRFPPDTMNELLQSKRILFGADHTKIVEIKVYASEYRDKLASVLELDGRLGPHELKEDFPNEGKVFSNPKPSRLLSQLFSFILREDGDLAVDFFAGSGTAARAVMQLNEQDKIRRRYLLVQLPEELAPDKPAQKPAADLCSALGVPPNLAEILKERLRRVGQRLDLGDRGFRVFKLDHSNIRTWDASPEDLESALFHDVEHLRKGRSELDVLYELLLKLGLDLCVPIEDRTIAGKTVHSIGAGTLFVCLPKKVTSDEAEELALGIADWREELATAGETTVVFRDSAFADDVAKSNASAILEQHGIENVRSL